MSLLGGRPRIRASGGCALIKGTKLAGGYTSLQSTDLPGFRITLGPDEATDIGRFAEILTSALQAYLPAYLAAQDDHDMQRQLTATISSAHLASRTRSLSAVAELKAA